MHTASRHHSTRPVIFLLVIAALITACEQQQPKQIQWQLPLQAPEDPHGSRHKVSSIVPYWATARQGEAEVIWLQKSTTRKISTKMALGGISYVEDWNVRLLGLATGLRVKNGAFLNDENVDNAAALVEIRHNGKTVYRDWLYEKFPELFGMDDPEWKVWLKGITLRPASKEDLP
jgi:hypothetical protein